MSAPIYDLVGGQPFFDALVDRFYDLVADDPRLRPLYPDDLDASRRHLAGFLAQYWGGPPEYSAARGHPRLRMRHAPFVIGPAERDAWLEHMTASVGASDATDEIAQQLIGYFDEATTFMINQP